MYYQVHVRLTLTLLFNNVISLSLNKYVIQGMDIWWFISSSKELAELRNEPITFPKKASSFSTIWADAQQNDLCPQLPSLISLHCPHEEALA